MGRRFLHALMAIVAAIMLVSDDAKAQVDAYHFTGINFNFANPGARARGIGGAFVALADDATASLANPAGLAFLDRQVSLEYVHDEEQAPVGQITQGGLDVAGTFPSYTLTPQNDPTRVWADSESDRINFASFVFPAFQRKIGLSVFYASLADLDQEYEVGAGVVCIDEAGSPFTPGAGQGCNNRVSTSVDYPWRLETYFPQSVVATLKTEMAGFGLGWKLSDRFSLGASAGHVETTFTGQSEPHPIEGITVGAPLSLETSRIDDSDTMYSVGVLYRGDVLGFGANYRSETQFNIVNQEIISPGSVDSRQFEGEFRIPERIAAGLALFPSDNWVIAAEYVHIPYSVMPEGMAIQFNEERQGNGVEYASADVDEYHAGFEYTTFSGGKGWSLRFGYWRDQTHLIFSSQGYDEPVTLSSSDSMRAAAALLYQEFELSLDHYTAGFGAAFGWFRIDAAVDYSSDAGTDFLVSGVLYF